MVSLCRVGSQPRVRCPHLYPLRKLAVCPGRGGGCRSLSGCHSGRVSRCGEGKSATRGRLSKPRPVMADEFAPSPSGPVCQNWRRRTNYGGRGTPSSRRSRLISFADHWHCSRDNWLAVSILLFGLVLSGCSGSVPTAKATNSASPIPSSGAPTVPTTTSHPSQQDGVWARLEERPLHIPKIVKRQNCPVSRQWATHHDVRAKTLSGELWGPGPAFPGVYTNVAALHRHGVIQMLRNNRVWPYFNGWLGAKVLWATTRTYRGPVLVRGHQVGGSHGMGFWGGINDESGSHLRFAGGTASNFFVPSVGCYAWQMDGLGFSRLIVFQVVETTNG